MKKIILTFFAAVLAFSPCVARNRFAIFTDSKTYEHCSAEIEQYRRVLVQEGLDARVYHSDWTSPEQVKSIILKLAAKQRKPLEGAVFIGEVPIVMVSGAQHLTTAFKMNEKTYPKQESSVASDRYYDDFDLTFEYIERDTVDTNRYFYRMTGEGAQTLRPEIYTARIKVPKFLIDAGKDKYELISKYLVKAVEAHKEVNILDNMIYFFGSGYNSEDLNVWRERTFASYEEFPYTKGLAGQHRFYNFHQDPQVKWNLFSELQRPETDFFQFSEHGGPAVQYINGGIERPGLKDLSEQLRISVLKGKWARSLYDSLAQHINPALLSDSAMAVVFKEDSIRYHHKDIYQEEIAAIRSNPRVVVLNACYNNSFHNPEGYVAGAHIFSDGRCVVAQGNTVNVLQDKYDNKLVGLLSMGMRVGLWQKEVSYLEAHLSGDPTFRFSPAPQDAELSAALYDALVRKPQDAKTWKKFLASDNAIARAAAAVHLGYAGEYESLLPLLRQDKSPMVRMSALDALSCTDKIEEALLIGLKDPYELILRQSMRSACDYAAVGTDSSICAAVRHIESYHPELVRLAYYTSSYERLIDKESYYYKETGTLSNRSAKSKARTNAARSFRNNNFIPAIDTMIAIIADAEDEEDVRIVCAEALGWYDKSAAKSEIIAKLNAMDKSGFSPALSEEIVKTLKRLEYK